MERTTGNIYVAPNAVVSNLNTGTIVNGVLSNEEEEEEDKGVRRRFSFEPEGKKQLIIETYGIPIKATRGPTLKIEFEVFSPETLLEDVHTEFGDGIFFINLASLKNLRWTRPIHVQVPEGFPKLNLITRNTAILVENVVGCRDILTRTNFGIIKVRSLRNGSNLTCQSKNGTTFVEGCELDGTCDVNSRNGDVSVTSANVAGDLKVITIRGHIRIRRCDVAGKVVLASTYSLVHATDVTYGTTIDAKCSSTSGPYLARVSLVLK